MTVDTTPVVMDELAKNRSIEVVSNEVITRALQNRSSDCSSDSSCIRQVGESVNADVVLIVRLAKLGDTVLVRMGTVDVLQGTKENTRQEVVAVKDEQDLQRVVAKMASEVSETYAPDLSPATSWYQKWWTWAIVAAVAAGGTAAGVGIAASHNSGNGEKPDITVVPP